MVPGGAMENEMEVTANLADSLAKRVRPYPEVLRNLRDQLDIRTGGELDTIELDLLTDMVEARIRNRLTTV